MAIFEMPFFQYPLKILLLYFLYVLPNIAMNLFIFMYCNEDSSLKSITNTLYRFFHIFKR